MSKKNNRYNSKGPNIYKMLGIFTLVLFIFVIASLMVTRNSGNSGQYTAEELLHDHDGDGVPDH